MSIRINIYNSSEKLFRKSAKLISDLIVNFVKTNKSCSLVLSGGSTPKSLYEILSSEKYKKKKFWGNVFFFWGDERCVPPDNIESNYKMAFDLLISKVKIPSNNVFRILSEMPHAYAALEYQNKLKMLFPGKKFPSFDIVLLGLGEDGHTASLYEESESLKETERWVTDCYPDKLKKWRITMTFPVLNNSKTIIFLVSGKSKAGIVKSVLKDKNKILPAAQIKPKKGELIWCLDKDAASQIKQ